MWHVAGSRWQVAGGSWQVARGRGEVEDVRWQAEAEKVKTFQRADSYAQQLSSYNPENFQTGKKIF